MFESATPADEPNQTIEPPKPTAYATNPQSYPPCFSASAVSGMLSNTADTKPSPMRHAPRRVRQAVRPASSTPPAPARAGRCCRAARRAVRSTRACAAATHISSATHTVAPMNGKRVRDVVEADVDDDVDHDRRDQHQRDDEHARPVDDDARGRILGDRANSAAAAAMPAPRRPASPCRRRCTPRSPGADERHRSTSWWWSCRRRRCPSRRRWTRRRSPRDSRCAPCCGKRRARWCRRSALRRCCPETTTARRSSPAAPARPSSRPAGNCGSRAGTLLASKCFDRSAKPSSKPEQVGRASPTRAPGASIQPPTPGPSGKGETPILNSEITQHAAERDGERVVMKQRDPDEHRGKQDEIDGNARDCRGYRRRRRARCAGAGQREPTSKDIA